MRRLKDHKEGEVDSASVRSYAPTLEAGGDVESLFGEFIGTSSEGSAWTLRETETEDAVDLGSLDHEDEESLQNFDHEFDELEQLSANSGSEGENHQVDCLQATKGSP